MTLEDLYYYENHYYAFNRRLLRFIGLWPYQKASERLFRSHLINLVLLASLLIQIYIWIKSDINMIRTINLMPTTLPVICFISVYNNIHHNYNIQKNLFDRIRTDWTELTDQRNINVMRKYARENKLYTMTITVLFYLYGIFLMLPSMIRVLLNIVGTIEDSQLILPIYVSFAFRNKFGYYAILLTQLICISCACTVGIAHYGMYITFIQHTYALCGIVGIKLDKPFKRNSSKSAAWTARNSKNSEEFYWFVGAIRCYNKVISFVDYINAIYSKTFLVEVSTGLLYVIMDFFYFFELIGMSASVNEILTCCIYTAASLFMIYAICYLGQRLINYNVDIYIKCCQIPFYSYSIKAQKTLLLLIMRSTRPFGLSMRGLMVSSHELFANIIRMSFSFATVFYNMR